MANKTANAEDDMRPHFEDIQAHYDLSDEFFGLFQDPTRKYSCAYFTGPNVTLSRGPDRRRRPAPRQARPEAGHDPARHRLRLGPDDAARDREVRRQRHRPDAFARTSRRTATQLLDKLGSDRTHEVRLQGWEQFHQPVDRIVSIEAFEHFGFERYDDFFKNCFDILPDDGRMTIQSSTGYHPFDLAEKGKKLTFELARFAKFIITEIFPGGRIPTAQMMIDHGEKAGFVVPECMSLRTHYIKTLGSGPPRWRPTRTRRSRSPTKRTTTGT